MWVEVFSPLIQGSLYSTLVVGGCAKMARELKWNSQNSPPTRHSPMKAAVLLSLAASLHVSTLVKLCVILPDSFIMLKSTIFCAAFFADSAKKDLVLSISAYSTPWRLCKKIKSFERVITSGNQLLLPYFSFLKKHQLSLPCLSIKGYSEVLG